MTQFLFKVLIFLEKCLDAIMRFLQLSSLHYQFAFFTLYNLEWTLFERMLIAIFLFDLCSTLTVDNYLSTNDCGVLEIILVLNFEFAIFLRA
jgi:hypothetical protein